jgi:hypothetical protein
MCLLSIITQGLRNIDSVMVTGDKLVLALKIFPSYCLTQAVFTDGSLESIAIDRKAKGFKAVDSNLWATKNISGDCFALIIHGIVWTTVLVLIETFQCKSHHK